MKSLPRLLVLAIILAGLGAGAWYATRGTAPERRNLDALVTVGGDVVRDVTHPALDLTRLSTAEEIALGQAIDAEVRAGIPVGGDPAAEIYVQNVLRLVAGGVSRRDIPYAVAMVRSPEVNAFAVAGGRLYVTDGMLGFVRSEAELAAVLGHEIGHVELGHCVQRLQIEQAARRVAPDLAGLARLGYEIMERGFSEEQELAADGQGALLAARAGYDAWQASQLFSRFLAKETAGTRPPTRNPVKIAVAAVPQALDRYLETHPPADQRIEAVRRALVSRGDLWAGTPRYVGIGNLTARRARSDDPRPGEWIARDRAPSP